ncbi:MAG TPA: M13 family metallopeptidase [Bryobacteraceae bacterium]
MKISQGVLFFAPLLLLSSAGFAQSATSGSEPSGIDVKAIDRSVNPCTDFYQYACGSWMKNNPIPPAYSRWGRFDQLQDENLKQLHAIAEDSEKNQQRSPTDQKVGAFYGACMDEAAVEKAGAKPLQPELDRIKALQNKSELAGEVARLHDQAATAFFRFGQSPDPTNARMTIASAAQGGLGLPEKGFYTRTGPKDIETRKRYVEHISKIFQLLGVPAADADAKAQKILKLETDLANASLDNVSLRNPKLTLHKMPLSQFEQEVPNFDFKQYLTDRSTPPFSDMNNRVPDFFKVLNTTIATTSLDDLKDYLTWHYVSAYAEELSSPFVNEDFDFYGRYLTGAKELQPRWKRCVKLTDQELGEALGKKYVEKYFGQNSKQKTLELVGLIERSMESDINSLTWMSDATKQQALEKLKDVTNKIGYPEKWRDYSSVQIVPDNLVEDVTHTREFEEHRELNKIGKPVDRKEWGMTPPTVNAYYSPLQNNINFPAGILQPPFYNNSADMAVNFGAIGVVIGHELTHGFDDQGRQYDGDGNLRDWWTAKDGEEFQKRAQCLVNQYSNFSPVEGVKLNGKLTLGENGADNAGIRLAYMALMQALANGMVDKGQLDGYTPQQRFFLGFAQVWCQNVRPEAARLRAQTDPHAPGEFRVVGVVQNSPEFAKAFGCSAAQPMDAGEKACRVW